MTSLFEDAQSRLIEVMKYVTLSDDVVNRLKYPKKARA